MQAAPRVFRETVGPGALFENPYSKLVDKQKREFTSKTCKFPILAGALGLEPRAYGFGDEADKSASGGTTFEVNISTIQKQIAAAI